MKHIILLIPHMAGGGAERVISLLANEFERKGHSVELVLTTAEREDLVVTDISPSIPLTLLSEKVKKSGVSLAERKANLLCKPYELAGKPVPARLAYDAFVAQYGEQIKLIEEKLRSDPESIAVAFLQPAIPMLMISAESLSNRVIFSERADPHRLMKQRYGKNFVEKYYRRTDYAVFQTRDAQSVYPEFIRDRSTVIFNPLKPNLPKTYHVERNKEITTFCRISKQKNLPLLVNSFALFHMSHSDYKLSIIGDAANEEGRQVKTELDELVSGLGLNGSVEFRPFSANVHSEIIYDAMYVNSSDYEGISNAMLEAMAIGLPVICTDCPIGGASAAIKDGENGMLVPVGDVDAMADAMSRIADDIELSDKLSENAAKLREELDIKTIAERWLEIL